MRSCHSGLNNPCLKIRSRPDLPRFQILTDAHVFCLFLKRCCLLGVGNGDFSQHNIAPFVSSAQVSPTRRTWFHTAPFSLKYESSRGDPKSASIQQRTFSLLPAAIPKPKAPIQDLCWLYCESSSSSSSAQWSAETWRCLENQKGGSTLGIRRDCSWVLHPEVGAAIRMGVATL